MRRIRKAIGRENTEQQQASLPAKQIKNMNEFKGRSSVFRSIFGAEYARFISPPFLILDKEVTLDIIKFDDYLKKRYKDYVEGLSMKDFIQRKFGEQGVLFINKEINSL